MRVDAATAPRGRPQEKGNAAMPKSRKKVLRRRLEAVGLGFLGLWFVFNLLLLLAAESGLVAHAPWISWSLGGQGIGMIAVLVHAGLNG